MYLPLTETEARHDGSDDDQKRESGNAIGLGRIILIVEDDQDLRLVAAEALTAFGFQVVEAGDGQSAKEIIEAGTIPDLLFADVVLPGPIDGQELAIFAQSKYDNIRILLSSGYALEGQAATSHDMDNMSFIAKPYGINELAQVIERLLQNG